MKYKKEIWDQLKGITVDDLICSLKKDGFKEDQKSGSIAIYHHHDGRRVSIHFHSHKTFGSNLLKGLLDSICWTEDDLKRLKLVK